MIQLAEGVPRFDRRSQGGRELCAVLQLMMWTATGLGAGG